MRVLKILRNITILLLVLVIVAGGVLFYMLSQVPVRAVKDYATIEITPNDTADYMVFLHPSGKYRRLLELDDDVRYQIAEYMKENNLVLQVGEQEFCALLDATFEELINQDFKFEKKQGHDLR